MRRAKGEHGQNTRTLNGSGQTPLVLGTDSGLAPGLDLASVRKKSPELVDLLVVDFLDMVNAEGAQLTPGVVSWPATASTLRRTSATRPLVSLPWRTSPSGSR